MGKYAFEKNFFFHAQMDFDGIFKEEHRNHHSFDDLDELLNKLGISKNENLTVKVIEESEKVFAHKLLLKDDYCLCSFDYAFDPGFPLTMYDTSEILVNNSNVFILYSKVLVKRYEETGSVYENGNPSNRKI